MPYLSVVVPAYNEEDRLAPTLARLHEYYSGQDYSYDVTVVSDGSKDGTGKIVEDFASSSTDRTAARVTRCASGSSAPPAN